jgi:hypothetical protein
VKGLPWPHVSVIVMSKYNDSTYYSGTNVDIGLANYNSRNEDQQSQQHKGK